MAVQLRAVEVERSLAPLTGCDLYLEIGQPPWSRPVKWCMTLSASSSPDAYAAAAIAITSSGSSTGSVSAFVIDSALM